MLEKSLPILSITSIWTSLFTVLAITAGIHNAGKYCHNAQPIYLYEPICVFINKVCNLCIFDNSAAILVKHQKYSTFT